MVRMGHSTTDAAIIYQHATPERDQELADALSKKVTKAHDKAKKRAEKERVAKEARPCPRKGCQGEQAEEADDIRRLEVAEQ